MAKPLDMINVGAGRAYPNPQDAVDASTGRYEDRVAALPLEQKLPFAAFPKVQDPAPFANMRKTGGARTPG